MSCKQDSSIEKILQEVKGRLEGEEKLYKMSEKFQNQKSLN